MASEEPSEEEVTGLFKRLDTSSSKSDAEKTFEPPSEEVDTRLFEEIDAYPWDKDSAFQRVLAAMLGSKSKTSPSQTQALTLRARLLYYARKKQLPPINFNAYEAHVSASNPTPSEQNPSYPTPFAEVIALITSGKPIPGIMEIPPTTLPEKATKPMASRRRKPWERHDDTTTSEKTFGDQRGDVMEQEVLEAKGSVTKPEPGKE